MAVAAPHGWKRSEANWRRRALDDWQAQPRWMRTVVVLLIVGLVMGVYRQGRRSMHVARDRRALQAFLAEMPSNDGNLHVCWEAALPFELVSPLDNLMAWERVPLVVLVWTQRTPWQEAVKQRFGITCLASALFERDDVVLVATPTHRALLTTFAKEHFQADVEFVESRAFGRKFVAGRFRRKAAEAGTAGEQDVAKQRLDRKDSGG